MVPLYQSLLLIDPFVWSFVLLLCVVFCLCGFCVVFCLCGFCGVTLSLFIFNNNNNNNNNNNKLHNQVIIKIIS